MDADLRAEPDLRVDPDLTVELAPDEIATPSEAESHDLRVADDGSFTVARCSCGWRSYARRSRSLARSEGADHLILYAGPTEP